MMYSDKYRYVYIAPSKTGSNSIRQFLKDNYDGQSLLSDHESSIPGHLSYRFDSYFKFISVRNIYDRCVSMWSDFVKEGQTFSEFIMSLIYKNPIYCCAGTGELLPEFRSLSFMKKESGSNHLVRLEMIEKDLECLPFIDKKVEFNIHFGKSKNKKHIILGCAEMNLVDIYEELDTNLHEGINLCQQM